MRKFAIALLMNDLHISKDNINEFAKNWGEALALCKERGIKDLVIGGDIFTSRSSQPLSVLLAVHDAFKQASDMGLLITVTNGNHDKVGANDLRGYCHVFDTITGVEVVETYTVICWDGCDFALIPVSYFSADYFDNIMEAILHDECVIDIDCSKIILYLHQGIHGALGDFDVPDELPNDIFKGFKSVLVGHYHNRTKIKGTNIQYIGSSRQHNFGEDEEKGYTILYSDGSTEFVKNAVNKRYYVIDVDLEDIDGVDKMLPDMEKYDVRVKVHCKDSEVDGKWKERLSEMGVRVDVLTEKIKISEIKNSGIEQKFDKAGLKLEYVHFCDNKNVPSELGIKYLNKID